MTIIDGAQETEPLVTLDPTIDPTNPARQPATKAERRERIRKYGLFTPSGLAEANELAMHLPAPLKNEDRAKLGFLTPSGFYRKSIDLPAGVAWVYLKLSRARGLSYQRVMAEVLTYYAVGISQDALENVPPIYQDLMSPQGIEALAQAMRLAFQQAGIPELTPAHELEHNALYPNGDLEEQQKIDARRRDDALSYTRSLPENLITPEIVQELENW
jgi:hypothetical protein